MRKQAVDKFGLGFFNKLNDGDAKGAFRSLIPRYTTEAFEYPSISTIVNNYSTQNSNNQNSNNVTIHTKTDNSGFLTSHFERWT